LWSVAFANRGKSFAKNSVVVAYIKTNGGRYEPSFGIDPTKMETDIGTDMPPGTPSFTTVLTKPTIRKEYFTQVLGEDRLVGILLRFKYSDIYGNIYREGWCEERLRTGAMANTNPDKCETSP
jgi:hypothetical protein